MSEENAVVQTEEIPEIEPLNVEQTTETPTPTETPTEPVIEEPAQVSDEEKAEADRQRKREKTQKRINQLTREKKEAQAEAEKYRLELESQRKVSLPDPDDFETQEDYISAVVEHRLQEKQTPEPVKAPVIDFDSIVSRGKEKYPDFQQVAMSDQNLTQNIAEVVALADNADDIFYHLGKNPVELERISLMDTAQMAREIGKIEATVSIPAPKTTQTPAPVKPLEGAETTPVDESKLSMKEWAKRRNAKRWKQGKI